MAIKRENFYLKGRKGSATTATPLYLPTIYKKDFLIFIILYQRHKVVKTLIATYRCYTPNAIVKFIATVLG